MEPKIKDYIDNIYSHLATFPGEESEFFLSGGKILSQQTKLKTTFLLDKFL